MVLKQVWLYHNIKLSKILFIYEVHCIESKNVWYIYCNLSNMFLSLLLYISRYEALSAESLINNLWKCSLRGDSYKCIFWFTLQTFVWWKIQNLYVWWNICPQFLKCKHCLEFNFIWWPRSGLWIPNIEVWIRLIAFLIGIAQARNIYFVWKKKDLLR